MLCKKCCKCTCFIESNGYQPKKNDIPSLSLSSKSYEAKSKWFGLIVERSPKRP